MGINARRRLPHLLLLVAATLSAGCATRSPTSPPPEIVLCPAPPPVPPSLRTPPGGLTDTEWRQKEPGRHSSSARQRIETWLNMLTPSN